jgi:glycosyltransferase 2 family protein
MGVRGTEVQYMGLAGAAFYVCAIAAIVLVYFREEWLEHWLRRLLPAVFREKAIGLLRAFAEGLTSIRSWRQLAMVTLLSLASWVVIAASFWPVLAAFDFGAAVPLYTPFLLIATLGLALMIPAAPAGIGPFQYACLLTLRIVFAPMVVALGGDFNEKAAAFSLVAHLSQAGPEIIMGFIFFLFEGLSLRDVQADL